MDIDILKYSRNCFLLTLPILLWNIVLSNKLPKAFQPEIFWEDIPSFIAYSENILRLLVFISTLLMPLSIVTFKQREGLILYIGGTLLYFASWLALIYFQDSKWSNSLIGFSAPAYTPLLWLTGIGLIGNSFFFNIPFRRWIFILTSVLFLVFHNIHTYTIYNRMHSKDQYALTNARFIKTILLLLVLISQLSCSTIKNVERNETDLFLDNTNTENLNGTFLSHNLKSNWSVYEMLYDEKIFNRKYSRDSILLNISLIKKDTVKLTFILNDTIIKTMKLNGKYAKGYFSIAPKFRLRSPLFPILWGPSSYTMSFGISRDNNLIVLESHSGVAILLVIPFFASGGKSKFQFTRIY